MTKEAMQRRFGAQHWVTLRDTGEHVQIEAWSTIKAAYRVRTRKGGVFLVPDADLDELPPHPEADRGKHWSRCAAMGCGSPLTPGLEICERCKEPICTCGRCHCAPGRSRAKKPAKAKPAAP